jgi:Zn finger protein HypA/HybF involved in hydrogenase expression
MPEKYIKASECEKYFYDHLDDYNIISAMNAIEEMPAADVAPVRHGKWIYDNWCEFKCSECGEYSNSKPYKGKEKYCPNCGSRMGGEIK